MKGENSRLCVILWNILWILFGNYKLIISPDFDLGYVLHAILKYQVRLPCATDMTRRDTCTLNIRNQNNARQRISNALCIRKENNVMCTEKKKGREGVCDIHKVL